MNTNETDQERAERHLKTSRDLIAHLYAHDVVSVILRDEESKRMIVKLGLTIPIGPGDSMLCGREGDTIYLFACTRNPNRNGGRLAIAGYRFEVDQYLRQPLQNIPEVRDAFRYCAFAVARVEGINLWDCAYKPETPILS